MKIESQTNAQQIRSLCVILIHMIVFTLGVLLIHFTHPTKDHKHYSTGHPHHEVHNHKMREKI